MKIEEKLAVMKAFAAGKTVESKSRTAPFSERGWEVCPRTIEFNFSYHDYRVQPPKPLELWASVYDDTDYSKTYCGLVYSDKNVAERNHTAMDGRGRIVRMREVTDES